MRRWSSVGRVIRFGFTLCTVVVGVAVGSEVETSWESIVDSATMMRLRGAKRDGRGGEEKGGQSRALPRYRMVGSISANFKCRNAKLRNGFLLKYKRAAYRFDAVPGVNKWPARLKHLPDF